MLPVQTAQAGVAAATKSAGWEVEPPFAGGWPGPPTNSIVIETPRARLLLPKTECCMNHPDERCFFCRTQKPTVAVKLLGIFVWICDECHDQWRLQKDR